MRPLVLSLAVLSGCAAATTPVAADARVRPRAPARVRWDGRPLEALLAESARTGKRVVVDFYAQW